jgi:hypothetical protein
MWTGDLTAAAWVAPVLFWYMLSNGLKPLVNLPYLLQSAHGDLRLQTKLGKITPFLMIPVIVIAAYWIGPIGPGIAWIVFHVLLLCAWPVIVHRKFAPDIVKDWYMKDIFPILIATMAAMVVVVPLSHNLLEDASRIETFFLLSGSGMFVLVCAALASSYARFIARKIFLRLRIIRS